MNDPSEMLYFALDELRVLKVSASSVSSLPAVVNDSRITADMVARKMDLSNSSAQTSDWEIKTETGKVTIGWQNSTISGTTDIDLWLVHGR